MIKIKINDKEIKTESGQTILDVATANGIDIPTLCHDEELKPFGSCWVCAVKVKDRSGFVTSCGTEIMDGMEIITNSEEVINARKMALELLLSDHYADCEAPCKMACPDHVDVQSYVSLIANGEYQEATKVIKENLPMPLSIGRVCPAFCEEECRRDIVDEPIAIRQLKRHAADFDLNLDWSYIPEKKKNKNKKVAIVGAGPSGLTCGYYLSNEGYKVKVFESAPKAGGWLRYGIPEYRLPKEILDKEIDLMCKNGMKIKYNIEIGQDISLSKLNKDYDAVYLAIGAQNAVPMRVKNNDLKGCYLGVDFLKDVVLGKKPKISKKVAVVGGGNTAIDCARTAKRLGAEVTIIYRRTRKEMPAESYEVDAAEEEGIKFHFLTNPVENIEKSGKLSKIKLEKMKLGKPDASGRRRPLPTGKFFQEKYGTVIAAISQKPNVEFLAEKENKISGKELPLTRWNTIKADEETQYTGIKNIFGGGDFRRGPATAIEAIADGRKAARSIDRVLQKKPIMDIKTLFNSTKEEKLDDVDSKEYEQYEEKDRINMPELDAVKRAENFKEVEIGYSDSSAIEEAKRCLECGCQVNESCKLRDYSTEYEIEPNIYKGDKNKHPIDESHPFILRDANKCISCGRCVRICSEIQGPGVLGYIYRGFTSYVAPEFGESLTETTCESCGKCIEVCPVGALTPKNMNFKLNPHSTTKIVQNCGLCGMGCEIEVNTIADNILVINPSADESFNKRNLCFDGKFGWQIFDQKERITQPYQKDIDRWEEFEDTEDVIELIKNSNETSNTKKIYISSSSTLEEMLVMKQVASNIGAELCSLSHESSFVDKIENTTLMNKTYKDIKKADTYVIVGKISQTLKTMIRAQQRKGKKMFIITDDHAEFNRYADELFENEAIVHVLDRLLATYNGESETENDELSDVSPLDLKFPMKTMFFYDRDNILEESIWNIWAIAGEVCDFEEGSGVMPTSHFNNFNGLKKLGIKPGKPTSNDFTLFYGELPCEDQKRIIRSSKFMLSINTHIDDADPAHVILPKPSYLEMNGTSISNNGRNIKFKNPKNTKLFDDLLRALYKAGLLEKKHINTKHWNKKAENFANKKVEKVDMSRNQLFDYLNSIQEIHLKKVQQASVQKRFISKLKKNLNPNS